MTMTKASKCPECGKVHDCAFYVEMQGLLQRLSKVMTTTGDLVRYDSQEIDRLVEYVKACDKAGLSTPEIHPLEDK